MISMCAAAVFPSHTSRLLAVDSAVVAGVRCRGRWCWVLPVHGDWFRFLGHGFGYQLQCCGCQRHCLGQCSRCVRVQLQALAHQLCLGTLAGPPLVKALPLTAVGFSACTGRLNHPSWMLWRCVGSHVWLPTLVTVNNGGGTFQFIETNGTGSVIHSSATSVLMDMTGNSAGACH